MKKRLCRVCGGEYVPPSPFPGCCSEECKGERKVILVKKKSLSFDERKFEQRKLGAQKLPCGTCGKLFYVNVSRANGHSGYCTKSCSRPQRVNKSLLRKTKTFSNSFYLSESWKILRFEALMKYGNRCQCCGASPPQVVLHVDHIKPRAVYPELAFDINNLQILCESCNIGKGHRHEVDFRTVRKD